MRGTFRSVLIAGLIASTALPSLAAPRLDVQSMLTQVRYGDAGASRRADFDPSNTIAQGAYPLSAIIDNIRRSYPGRSLETEGPYQQGGRMVYRIKWWTNGRVIVFFADAETGQIIAQRGG